MENKIERDLSGTAFIVNYSRSKLVDISKDVFAKLWVTPDAISLWNDLAKNVYPNDDLNLSLRNRFYLELLQNFIDENANPVFINIAAGFTNYPFLVDGDCRFVEVDLPNIIEIKKAKVAEFIEENKLPLRNVEYLSVDLNSVNQRSKMKKKLSEIIGENPSFVAMEGLTYYLSKDVLNDIFGLLRDVQKKDSIIAFDYWKPDALEYPTMVKLKEYLDRKFGYHGQDWNLFDNNYIKDLNGYAEVFSTNMAKLELQYSNTKKFQGRENTIPDNFCVLKKMW